MSLRIIYGKSGSGKSKFCFDEIAKLVKTEKKIYIITPEQFSFTAEKRGNMTQLEARTDGISNTLTTVQKDNLVLEIRTVDDG